VRGAGTSGMTARIAMPVEHAQVDSLMVRQAGQRTHTYQYRAAMAAPIGFYLAAVEAHAKWSR